MKDGRFLEFRGNILSDSDSRRSPSCVSFVCNCDHRLIRGAAAHTN